MSFKKSKSVRIEKCTQRKHRKENDEKQAQVKDDEKIESKNEKNDGSESVQVIMKITLDYDWNSTDQHTSFTHPIVPLKSKNWL